MDRRTFVAAAGGIGVAALGAAPRRPALARSGRITLLHTNDTHSRLDPFPPGHGALSGRGGIARRAALVGQLRKELGAVLLLDAGDVFQGTPYFNLYKGRLDYQLMSMMGYDAATLGNHDFDNGVEGLLAAMEEARFPFVNCNFDFKGAPALAQRVRPYVVRNFPGVRVGITGVGIAFSGLVAPKNHEGVVYRDPAESLRPVLARLREVEKVDLVVLLSHLGHDMQSGPSDLVLAATVPGIDVIIGGHSHTFLDEPVRVKQAEGETHIFQVGFAGVNLGRMDFSVQRRRVRAAAARSLPVRPSAHPS